ncbi:hypothetical protein KBI23_27900 [bacterium]|nr:hypothetical protein [bacterium]MBP9809602.1 hypothetical protein [bacterium]
MSKKGKKQATSPERLVLALIENAHYEEALVLLDEVESKQKNESEVKVKTNKTVLLYAKALASFGAAGANPSEQALATANAVLHQAFAVNNFVLPLMVSRINQVSNKTSKGSKHATKTVLPTAQHQADRYIDLWFGSWLQTENAFDWLGNQFVEWTKATKIERLMSQHETMIANSKKLDLDFFLN